MDPGECAWEPARVGDAGCACSPAPGFMDVCVSGALCGLPQWACALVFSLASGERRGPRGFCVRTPRRCACGARALLSLPRSTWRCAIRGPSEPSPAVPEPCCPLSVPLGNSGQKLSHPTPGLGFAIRPKRAAPGWKWIRARDAPSERGGQGDGS